MSELFNLNPVFPFRPQPNAAEAWTRFERALARALTDLSEDELLVIMAKHGSRFVQFADQGPYGLRAEAVSNTFLDGPERLSESACDELVGLGWQPPTHDSDAEREQPVDGSPNFYLDIAPPCRATASRRWQVLTLRDVFGIGHPGLTKYAAFADDGARLLFQYLPIDLVDEQMM